MSGHETGIPDVMMSDTINENAENGSKIITTFLLGLILVVFDWVGYATGGDSSAVNPMGKAVPEGGHGGH